MHSYALLPVFSSCCIWHMSSNADTESGFEPLVGMKTMGAMNWQDWGHDKESGEIRETFPSEIPFFLWALRCNHARPVGL